MLLLLSFIFLLYIAVLFFYCGYSTLLLLAVICISVPLNSYCPPGTSVYFTFNYGMSIGPGKGIPSSVASAFLYHSEDRDWHMLHK